MTRQTLSSAGRKKDNDMTRRKSALLLALIMLFLVGCSEPTPQGEAPQTAPPAQRPAPATRAPAQPSALMTADLIHEPFKTTPDRYRTVGGGNGPVAAFPVQDAITRIWDERVENQDGSRLDPTAVRDTCVTWIKGKVSVTSENTELSADGGTKTVLNYRAPGVIGVATVAIKTSSPEPEVKFRLTFEEHRR